jgi:Flp pilus assembly pilin Flp
MQGRIWRRLLVDDSGQDLIEYGLLASIIAVAGATVLPSVRTAMGNTFSGWNTAFYNLWTPNPPGP